MSTKLLDLEDRIITDEGEVVFKRDFLIKRVLTRKPYTDVLADDDEDFKIHNQRVGDSLPHIYIWNDNGEASGPSENTYEWTIPEEYQKLDIPLMVGEEYMKKVDAGIIKHSTRYVDRIIHETTEMETRGMFPFVRCLLYARDKFRENGIVWGVGRGSSCACLILYLLDINRVDPIKYDIPPEEFFKPEKITNKDI